MAYLNLREKDECDKAVLLGRRFGQPDFSYKTCPYDLHLRSAELVLDQEVNKVFSALGLYKKT